MFLEIVIEKQVKKTTQYANRNLRHVLKVPSLYRMDFLKNTLSEDDIAVLMQTDRKKCL